MPSKSTGDATAASGRRLALAKALGDLKARSLSAVLLGPPVVAAVWYGGLPFRALLLAVAVVAGLEWLKLGAPRATLRFKIAGMLALLIVVSGQMAAGPLYAVVLGLALVVLFMLWLGEQDRAMAVGIAATLPYVGGAVVALDWLREGASQGFALSLFLLLVIWATDIGAYATGRLVGGPRLAPRISPNKTWSGLLGGMLAAALVGFLVATLTGVIAPLMAPPLAMVLAVCGQAGDFFESFMKRRCDVKDSGKLIPGHGGLLDRIDGLMVAAPVLALYQALFGESFSWW